MLIYLLQAMTALSQASWSEVKEAHLRSLGSKDARSVLCSTSLECPVTLVGRLYNQYSNRYIVKQIQRLRPVLWGIYGLREAVGSFTQFDPQISSLVWGSISFVVTVGRLNKPPIHELLLHSIATARLGLANFASKARNTSC